MGQRLQVLQACVNMRSGRGLWLQLLYRGCDDLGHLQGVWKHLKVLPLYQPQPCHILANALAHKNSILWQVLPQGADCSGQGLPLRLHLLGSEPAYAYHIVAQQNHLQFAIIQKQAGSGCMDSRYGL